MKTIHISSSLRLLACIVGLTAFALSSVASTLLHETFSDGNRTADPSWYWMTTMAASNRVDTLADNAWTVGTNTVDGGGGYVVARFVNAPLSVVLAIGESITFSFNFSYAADSANAGNHLRFGIFDTGGSNVSADMFTNGVGAFNSDTGYGAFYTLQGTTSLGGYSLRCRASANEVLWSTSAFTTTLSPKINSDISTAGTTYGASLTITRTELNAVTITSVVNGQTIERTDITPASFSFDLISVYVGGANGTLTLSNLDVIYTSKNSP